eukprot:5197374-Prymnesium_polylepis.2
MPPLDSSADNRNKQRKTHLHNITAVARNIFRPEGWLLKYLALRLSTDCGGGSAGGSAAYLTGHHDAVALQQLIFGFIEEYLLCKCGSPETLLYTEGKKRRKTAKLRCHSCGRDGKAAGQEEKMLNLFEAQPMRPELCPMLRGELGPPEVAPDASVAEEGRDPAADEGLVGLGIPESSHVVPRANSVSVTRSVVALM